MRNHVRLFEEFMASDARGYDVGEYVYHVTPVENLATIMRVGLVPRDGVAINGRKYENRLYFATSLIAAYDISVNFQSHGRGREYSIIKVSSEAVARGRENDPLFEHGIYVDYPVGPGAIIGVTMANDLFGKYDDVDLDRLYENAGYSGKSWWHGSRERFGAFDRPQVTRSHAEHNVPTWWFAEDPEYAMRYADVEGGGWMYEVRLDLSGVLDLSDPAERGKFEAWLADRPGEYSQEEVGEIFDERWGRDLPYWTNHDVLWYAAMEGYSSAYFEEELEERVVSVAVIGDPSIIKIVGRRRV